MMENYDSNGLEDEQIKEILKQEMAEEYYTNLDGLVASYHNVEKALFGENVQADEDDRDEHGKIDVEEENLAAVRTWLIKPNEMEAKKRKKQTVITLLTEKETIMRMMVEVPKMLLLIWQTVTTSIQRTLERMICGI